MPRKQTTGFLIERDENQIVLQRPPGICILAGLLALLFTITAGIMAFALVAVLTNARGVDAASLFVTGLFTLVFGALALFTGSLSSPSRMRLDLRSRTYRYHRGLPFAMTVTEGPFTDFDYLYLRSVIYYNYGDPKPDSRIYLVWRKAPRLFGIVPQPEFLLQMLPDIERIEQEAGDYARLLNIPLEPKRRSRSAPASPVPAPAQHAPAQPATPSAPTTPEPLRPDAPLAAGSVVNSEGAVVDVRFNPTQMPPIFNAITITDPMRKLSMSAVVAHHLPGGIARCVLVNADERPTPGLEARDTDGPDVRALPVETLRRAVEALGRDRSAESTLLETGMKAVDLLCPIPRGGKVGIFAEWGVGAAVLIPELLHLLQNHPGGLTIFLFLQIPPDASRYRETIGELPIRSGERATVYLPVQNPEDPALRNQLDLLDVSIHLARRLGKQGLYPPIDPETSRSNMLDRYQVGPDHIQTVDAVRKALHRSREFQSAIETSGIDSLPPTDRLLVSRARKIERFLTQPFFVAEPYTGVPGQSVPLMETIRGCNAILNGELDQLPEQKFYMIGRIE